MLRIGAFQICPLALSLLVLTCQVSSECKTKECVVLFGEKTLHFYFALQHEEYIQTGPDFRFCNSSCLVGFSFHLKPF